MEKNIIALNGSPIFTMDWFSRNVPLWKIILNDYRNKPNLCFLEIGVFEGLCTRWLLDNILTHPTSKIYCCDIFDDIHYKSKYKEIYEHFGDVKIKDIFLNNINCYFDKIKLFDGFSSNVLKKQELLNETFDFVYIDASHKSCNVLEDAILSFPLVKSNGIIIFDDYLQPSILDINNPKIGIDSFLNSYVGLYELIHVGYQVVIKKF